MGEARLTGGYICGSLFGGHGDRCLAPEQIERVEYFENRPDVLGSVGGAAALVLVSPAILALAASAEAGREPGDGLSAEERSAALLLSAMSACLPGEPTQELSEAVWTYRQRMAPSCLDAGASWFASAGDLSRARNLTYLAGARRRFQMVICGGQSGRPPWAPAAPDARLVAQSPDWPSEYRVIVEDPTTYQYSLTGRECVERLTPPSAQERDAALAVSLRFDLFELPDRVFAVAH